MGILSDFFVASPQEATSYEQALLNEEPDLEETYETRNHKGFTGIEVGRLWALLLQKPFSVPEHMFEVVSREEDEGLIEQFPELFVAKLAAMPASSVPDFARRWASDMGEETSHDPEYLAQVIGDLQTLALRACSEEKGLFLWYQA